MLFINTRPIQRAKSLTDFLQKQGITVLELPLLELVACELSEQEKDSLKRLGTPHFYTALVFISETAVRYFFEFIQSQQIVLTPDITVIAVGQQTAHIFTQHWQKFYASFPNLLTPSQYGLPENNEGLVQLPFIQNLKSFDKVCILKGKNGRELFKTTLMEKGINVAEVAFYQRIVPPLSHAMFQQFCQNFDFSIKPIVLITSLTAWQHWQDLVRPCSAQDSVFLSKFTYLILQSRIANVMAHTRQDTLMSVIGDLQPTSILHALHRYPSLPNQGNSMTTDPISAAMKHALKNPDHPLAKFAVVFEQVVAWGDMDAFNHVNNVQYYAYAQAARIHFMQQFGMFGDNLVKTVLATSSCQYLRAVTFPDTLWIGVRTKKIGNTSMVQEYAYFSTGQNAIVATGEAVLVMFEADGVTKRPLSEAEKQKIVALEK